jgi:hypothetical protein
VSHATIVGFAMKAGTIFAKMYSLLVYILMMEQYNVTRCTLQNGYTSELRLITLR